MEPKEPELACKLLPPELAARRAGLLRTLRESAIGREPLEEGCRLTFGADEKILELIASVMEAERACCPFLRFDLETGHGRVQLSVTGPVGTAVFVRDTLGL
jgi:hypothetical protein